MENHLQDLATVKLRNDRLSELPATVARPMYDRSRLKPGIIHIGVGNFHRAHQAWYQHLLMQSGKAHDWAIIGAGVRPYDEVQRQKLAAQDYLTTLIELDPDGISAEVIGPMIDYIPVEQDNQALIERLAQADIRIVSLTVTEGGYFIDPATKLFDKNHPDIVHDAENPGAPKTAFGAIVRSLILRHDRGIGPFTGLSCDNLQGNGTVLRQTVVGLAGLSDPDLADWIDQTCSFPNSMVDCIVPSTGPAELELANDLGIDDAAPVMHENFRQWVIEDAFCAGRPDWEEVGVEFSDDVRGFEAQKIRILNAGHQILANAGELLGIESISQVMENPTIHAMFRKVELEEIVPHVKPVPGMTPEAYVDLVDRRFSNSAVFDTTRRVAFDGSSRHPGFVLPSVVDGLQSDGPVKGDQLTLSRQGRVAGGTARQRSLCLHGRLL